jgi:crotonobetainyl-CoA:carnitine CoA-transferase CaiB-like acyl-CoA transferase
LRRVGNRSLLGHLQGIYACAGDERWLALATDTAARWDSLLGWLGRPEWGDRLGAQLPTDDARVHDGIDGYLAAVFAPLDLEETVTSLTAAGIPAAAVVLPGDIEENPQHVARGFFESLEHPVAGVQRYPGLPFRLAQGPEHWFDTPPPRLGQHNAAVLGDELGLADDELQSLRDRCIIGNRPLGL